VKHTATVQRGIDALTLTVPTYAAERLLEQSAPNEVGGLTRGFQRSEKRDVLGGQAWRKWDPYQPSKAFGLQYESWEAARGPDAHCWSGTLRGWDLAVKCRATRVDVAWTFDVRSDVYPDDVIDPEVQAFAKERKFRSPVAGEHPAWTRYLGVRGSSRMLRVYRKDLQSPVLGFLAGGALLRVELETHEDFAAELWRLFVADPDSMYAAAAAHVLHMTGRDVQHDVTCYEPITVPEEADSAQLLLQFMKQNPTMAKRLLSAPGYVRQTLGSLVTEIQSRTSEYRTRKREEAFVRSGGWESVLPILLRMVDSDFPMEAAS